ncbi:FkbM family methyltransferase [Terrabacter sp. GCM10028922]|uniref:FkbM family methyltransferase n=1 Tax=Terrabacter sp. GCM10028922 TaxID=3273428 RepID=UPI003615CE3B
MTADDAVTDARPTAAVRFTQNGHDFDVIGFVGDHIFETVRRTSDFYERVLLDALAVFVAPGDMVIDAGANLGNHALYFAGVCQANVVAFEAFAPTVALLERNVLESRLQDRVEVRAIALGREAGHVVAAGVNWANVGSTRFLPAETGVEVIALDDAGLDGRVALLKVDVEGMDVDVLQGARGLIDRDRPVISCEAARPDELARLDEMVVELGYGYLARYNATSTWVLLPARTPLEQVVLQRHLITHTSMSHIATRDLYYRLRLVNESIASLR